MTLPLEGVRVVDLSRNMPGPTCTMVLADFGADVVVVEEPRGGAEGGRRGEHTEQVLRDLGYSTQDIEGLRGSGAIG